MSEMLKQMLENVRQMTPLVHNITNYVTVNDCANILLACGGSPIMADDISEVEEIVSICNSLVINIGTLNERTVQSMLAAGKKANQSGRPIVFDPVGIGASGLRTETAKQLLEKLDFSVIRGNISEIKMVYRVMQDILEGISSQQRLLESRGVDASITDHVTEDTLDRTVAFAMRLSRMTKAVIVITGAIDIIADAETAYTVRNGHPMMSRITGCGCMLTSVLGAYSAANPKKLTEACVAAVCAMGVCGELAYEKVSKAGEGTGSFRTYLIDYMSLLEGTMLEQRAKLWQFHNERYNYLLYAVTDRSWLNGDNLVRQVREALEGGVTLLQLREKDMPYEEFAALAREIHELTMQYGIPLIINDNVDVALAVGAEGVHLGQEDMKIGHARARLGKDKIIGISAHSVEEARRAQDNGADYIGTGAVFATTTKSDAHEVSLDTLTDICRAVSIPVVAIGGITKDNILMLKGTGIAGVAVVSAIFSKREIGKAAQELSGLMQLVIKERMM